MSCFPVDFSLSSALISRVYSTSLLCFRRVSTVRSSCTRKSEFPKYCDSANFHFSCDRCEIQQNSFQKCGHLVLQLCDWNANNWAVSRLRLWRYMEHGPMVPLAARFKFTNGLKFVFYCMCVCVCVQYVSKVCLISGLTARKLDKNTDLRWGVWSVKTGGIRNIIPLSPLFFILVSIMV